MIAWGARRMRIGDQHAEVLGIDGAPVLGSRCLDGHPVLGGSRPGSRTTAANRRRGARHGAARSGRRPPSQTSIGVWTGLGSTRRSS